MKGVVKGMDKSLASMNIEQLSKVMDKFESQFEDLDVKVRSGSPKESVSGNTICSTNMSKRILMDSIFTINTFLFFLLVQTQYMEGTMNATTAMSTPAEQVDTLIEQVADEHNLALGEAFTMAGPVGKKVPDTAEAEKPVADDLESRLANLRN